MIFGSKIYRVNPFIFVSLLTIILTGCGGGGTEDSPPPANNNTSSSSSPVAIASSSQATSNSTSQSSAPASKSSTQATGSEPNKTNLSSSSQSSYVRSSRSSDSSTDLDDFDTPPPEDNEDYVDLPPSAPKALQLDIISRDGVVISWGASTDDVGLSRYEIRRDGVAIGTSTTNKRHFEDSGLQANTDYTYTVRAIDTAGNRSNFSNSLVAKTASLTSTGSSSTSKTSSSAISHSSATSQSQSTISSSSASQTSISSAPSSSSVSSKTGVRVEWITPSSRENGDYLELEEIGGYEIRYKATNSSVYVQEIITNKHTTFYERSDITVDTVFQIAAFDTNGLYSRFIQLTPH